MNLQLFNALVPALLHTLWIGLAVAALLFLALRHLSGKNARLRYALGIVALLAVFLGGLIMLELPDATSEAAPEVPIQEYLSGAPAVSPQTQVESLSIPAPQTNRVKRQPADSPNWRLWFGIVWVVGAGISLLRLMRISLGIQQLVRRSRGGSNPVAIRLAAELSRIAGTSRRIVLLTGEHILQPAVVGIFRPAIFLPLSVITGLPEWQLRAILAHELAHIVRHDFLVNALQLLAETILFFNPAVWWINRRIREEREACCDAMAATWIDNPHALAEVLVNQATLKSSALPAFGNSNTVKERILRLIDPARQPRLKLPLKTFLLVALIAVGGLMLAKKSTSEVVGYMKRLRIVEAASLTYATLGDRVAMQDTRALNDLTVDLTLTTDDGSALQLPITIALSGAENQSTSRHYFEDYEDITCVQSNLWRFRLKLGKNGIESQASQRARGVITEYNVGGKHYADTKGPGGVPDSSGYLKLPLITLSEAYTGKIRFVDQRGKPVQGVKVSVSSNYQPLSESNKKGIADFSLLKNHSMRMDIVPPDGYCCEDEKQMSFKEGELVDWELKPGLLFEGRIVDLEGNAIPKAKISLRLPGSHQKFNHGYLPFIYSNHDGNFQMKWMDPDTKYTLFIEAPGYMGKWIAPDISEDSTVHSYVMQPARKLTLVVNNTGSRDRLNIGGHFCTHGFQYFPRSQLRQLFRSENEEIYELDLWETKYRFRASWRNGLAGHGKHLVEFDGNDAPEKMILDLDELLGKVNKAVLHHVRLRIVPPDGDPMPKGTIEIGEKIEAAKTYALPENGLLETEIIMPPGTSLLVRAKSMSGYTIHQMIDPVSTNYTADCVLEPAGGIAITCVYTNGTPATWYSVYTGTRSVTEPENRYYHPIIYTAPDEHTCMREPLALKTKQHQISIRKNRPESEGGDLRYRSEWITLDEFNPVKKLECVLKPAE